jgi:hypothetical protein
LEDNDFALTEQIVIEEDLWNLRGFSRTCGRFENDSRAAAQGFYERRFEFKNGKFATIQMIDSA